MLVTHDFLHIFNDTKKSGTLSHSRLSHLFLLPYGGRQGGASLLAPVMVCLWKETLRQS